MSLGEKYWTEILYTFLRFFSILLIISGIGFIIAGWLSNPWFYMGLLSWPLFIMLGAVNLKYVHLLEKRNRIQLDKIVNNF